MTERPPGGRIAAAQRRLDRLVARAAAEGSGDLLREALAQLGDALEDLQVADEALRTTRAQLVAAEEDLQSANEELRTINEQLRQRADDATRVDRLLASILADLDVGVVVVDRHLDVAVWNHKAEDLWGLCSEAAVGRPLLGLVPRLLLPRLREPLQGIIDGGQGRQELALDANAGRGAPRRVSIALTPLPGPAKECEGVMLQLVGG